MLHRLTLITTLFFWTTGVGAQVRFQGVDDLWKYADGHNVSIINAQFELAKARAGVTQSHMAFLPTVSAQATFTENTSLQTTLIPAAIFGGPENTYQAVRFGQRYIYNGAVIAQLDLVNVQTWFNTGIAKATAGWNEASVGSTRKSIYQQIATQYYNYLLMAEAGRLSATTLSIADSIYESALGKWQAGVIGRGSLDIAELNRERSAKDLDAARYQLEIARNNLKALLGMSVTDSLELPDNLPTTLSDNQSADAYLDDPTVRTAWFQKQLGQKQFQLVKSTIWPSLSLQYYNSTQQNDNEFRPFQGGASWFPATYWQLKATWSLFNGGTRWLQYQKGRIGLHQYEMQYESAVKQSAISDANLRLQLLRTGADLRRSQRILALALDNYRHMANKYEAGVVSLDDRMNAFTDYINNQNLYLNSLSDHLIQLYSARLRRQTF